MKSALLALLSILATASYAQDDTAPSTTTTCINQPVFERCKADQDNYLRNCSAQDFACQCRWNKVKLQCWDDSCPNDPERHSQEGLTTTYCSMPGANVTLPAWTNTLTATSTSTLGNSAAATGNTGSSSRSDASGLVLTSHEWLSMVAAAGIAGSLSYLV